MKRKSIKRVIGAVLTTSLLVSMLGVTNVAVFADDKETVRILVPGLSEQSTIDPISGLETKGLPEFQEFLNEQIPDYNIEVKTIAWDGWIQSMEAMVTAGDIDVGFFTNQEAVPDWYADLTPYLEKDEEVNFDNLSDLYIEPAVHYTTYKSFNHPEDTGKVYGLPMTVACNLITYDSKLFEEWGVEEPTEDMTFSELVDLAEKMTGTNPVTGKQNYGGYMYSSWTEWYSLCYNAIKPYLSDDMDINNMDMDEFVEYMKTSPEMKAYFSDLIRLVDCCNPAVATGSGAENWLTEDNDIAINFDVNGHTKTYMQYVYADDTEMTDRYKALLIPTGDAGEGFPEFFRFAIANNTEHGDAARDVIKQLTTNKEIIDFYLKNYAYDKLSCLKDTSGISMMEDYDINVKRHDYQMDNMFITDDYWYWRTPMQTVINQILSKQYTADEAVEAMYDGVNEWINNIKQQSAN